MGKLTDLKIKSLKPTNSPYKVSDGMGLYLLVTPKGSKLWRMNYRFRGKQKTLALGIYPMVSLQEARELCLTAKKLLAQGLDPAENLKSKNLGKNVPTFKDVAEKFYQKNLSLWKENYAKTVKIRLEKWIYPYIGEKLINEVRIQDITEILDFLVKNNKLGTAKKVKLIIGQVFRYALSKELVTFDPTQALKGYIKYREKHYPAKTTAEGFRSVLKAIWDYPHSITVKNALKILIYTFQRPGEVVSMKWEDIDLENREWKFILSKLEREHIVPLSNQVVNILKEQETISKNMDSPFVFPSFNSPKTRHMSVEALNAALKRMGINTKEEQTSHGFRAVARTLLHEVLEYEPDVIELQLGHKVPDRLGEAYNRAKFLNKRKEMMQKWADFVDSLVKS